MKTPPITHIVNWIFYAAMGFLGQRAVGSLDKLEGSVSTLNEKMAVVIQITAHHEKQIEKQEERIRNLEVLNKRQ